MRQHPRPLSHEGETNCDTRKTLQLLLTILLTIGTAYKSLGAAVSIERAGIRSDPL